MRTILLTFSICLIGGALLMAEEASLSKAFSTIKAVRREGEGNEAAREAAKVVSNAKPAELTQILAALDDADPIAANWLRGGFEAAAQKAGKDLPAKALEAFVLDRTHDGRGRRLAFEWLTTADPGARERLVPRFLDDPSAELRRDAVTRLIGLAKKESGDAATKLYEEAFSAAVDGDQVQEIAKALTKAGKPVDLVEHFGFVTRWTLVGPFDNRETKGFNVAYPPEKELNLQAEYEGMSGKVAWTSLEAPVDKSVLNPEKVGLFDIAKLTAPHKGAATYATTDFYADKDQPVEFRLSTSNAWKLWVNGELVFARDEYHRGMFFDQYIVPGKLKAGKNVLLLKVCQNEQKEDWAQDWSFQFRVCDPAGKAVLSTDQRTMTQR